MAAARKSSLKPAARKRPAARRPAIVKKPAAKKPAKPVAAPKPLKLPTSAAAAKPAEPATGPKPVSPIAVQVRDMVERELQAVDRVLAVLDPSGAGDAERAARTLASLARTLRELSLVSPSRDLPQTETTDDDDAIPRDLDEFRRELARRIENFVGERPDGGIPGGPDGGVEPPAGE